MDLYNCVYFSKIPYFFFSTRSARSASSSSCVLLCVNITCSSELRATAIAPAEVQRGHHQLPYEESVLFSDTQHTSQFCHRAGSYLTNKTTYRVCVALFYGSISHMGELKPFLLFIGAFVEKRPFVGKLKQIRVFVGELKAKRSFEGNINTKTCFCA